MVCRTLQVPAVPKCPSQENPSVTPSSLSSHSTKSEKSEEKGERGTLGRKRFFCGQYLAALNDWLLAIVLNNVSHQGKYRTNEKTTTVWHKCS